MKTLIVYVFRIQAERGARKVLKSEFSPHLIREILKSYRSKYFHLKPGIPKESTLGGRIMMELAALSIALYRELVARGKSTEEATQLFYEIAWSAYKPMGKLCWFLSGLGASSPARHLRKAVRLFTTFPFSSPSYQWQFINTGKDVVGFNCVRCPVAEYFMSHNLSELCVATWCNLDFPLAHVWNAELKRSGSIAGGAQVCDFRFKTLEKQHKKKHKTMEQIN